MPDTRSNTVSTDSDIQVDGQIPVLPWPHGIGNLPQSTEQASSERIVLESREPQYKNIVHLWEFLLELLANENCHSIITWSNADRLEFKIRNPEEVAKKWGAYKRTKQMNYEKLSRALRCYYKTGIIEKVPKQRLVYRFHKLPYNYEPGVTRSRHHGHRINACIGQQESGVTESRHHRPGINQCMEQQALRQAYSAPPLTNTAFSPVTTALRRTQSLPFVSLPSRIVMWCPDPMSHTLPLSDFRTRMMFPVAMDTIRVGFEPVEPVDPGNHVAVTSASSIPVSVIKRI